MNLPEYWQRGVGEPGGGVQDGPAGVRGCHCGAGQRERGLVQGPVSVILLSYASVADDEESLWLSELYA